MEALKKEVDMEETLSGTEQNGEQEPEKEIVENGVHNYSTKDRYVWTKDPKVLQKIEWVRFIPTIMQIFAHIYLSLSASVI